MHGMPFARAKNNGLAKNLRTVNEIKHFFGWRGKWGLFGPMSLPSSSRSSSANIFARFVFLWILWEETILAGPSGNFEGFFFHRPLNNISLCSQDRKMLFPRISLPDKSWMEKEDVRPEEKKTMGYFWFEFLVGIKSGLMFYFGWHFFWRCFAISDIWRTDLVT